VIWICLESHVSKHVLVSRYIQILTNTYYLKWRKYLIILQGHMMKGSTRWLDLFPRRRVLDPDDEQNHDQDEQA
jgi:hypothetical protein